MSGFYPELDIQPITNSLAAYANIGNTQANTQHTLASIPLVQAQAGLTTAQAGQTQAATVGQQIQNELQRIGLGYQQFGQQRFFDAAGGGAGAPSSGAANPLAGSDPSVGAPAGTAPVVPVAANALSPPGVQGGGGNALAGHPAAGGASAQGGNNATGAPAANGNPYAGLPPTQMAPGGINMPGVGVPGPMFSVMTAIRDPQGVPKLISARTTAINQAASMAYDNNSWNANLNGLYQQGWITAGQAAQFWNRFDLQKHFNQANASPDTQMSSQAALAEHNLEYSPTGSVQASQPAIGAQAQAAGAVAQAKGQYETKDITHQVGTDANGQPIYRTDTVQVSQLPAFMQANTGARPATSADMMNPAIKVSPDTLMARIAGAESGGNYGATNQSGPGGAPTSTAGGGLQFTVPTWVALVKSQRPDLAQGKTDQQIAAMRLDSSPAGIALQNQMGAVYAEQNAAALSKAGLPVNTETLRLAHVWGASGAQAIMNAPPGTKITPALIGQQAFNANPQWQGKTVNQVQADAVAQVGVNAVDFGGAGTAAGAGAPGAGAPAAAGQPAGVIVPTGAGTPPTGAAPQVPGVVVGPPVLTPQQKMDVALQQKQGEADIGQMVDMRKTLQTASDGAAQSNALIDQMRQESQTWQPGAFAAAKGRAMYYLDSIGQWAGFKPNQAVGDWQAFNKNAMQLTTQAVRATSANAAAQEFNMIRQALPSDMTSPQAFTQIADELEGINDWRIAKSAASGQWKGNANEFDAQWNSQISPTAFIVRRMSQQDAQTLATNLNKTPAGKALWQKVVQQSKMLASSGVLRTVAQAQ